MRGGGLCVRACVRAAGSRTWNEGFASMPLDEQYGLQLFDRYARACVRVDVCACVDVWVAPRARPR